MQTAVVGESTVRPDWNWLSVANSIPENHVKPIPVCQSASTAEEV